MKLFVDFSLLRRNRNAGLLLSGQFISFIGTIITGVALPYQIYHITRSVLMVGLLSLFQLLPLLITALLGGVLADRYHRRRLLIITESLLVFGSFALAINASLAAPRIWIIFLVAIVMSAINGLHRPALTSIMQQIIKKDDFAAAVSLRSLSGNLTMVAGPALGGLIIAHFGLMEAFIVDIGSFLISLIAILLMKNIPKVKMVTDLSVWSSLKDGCKYAVSRQELLGTYFVDFLAMIFGMPMALFPAIAEIYGGATTLGLFYAAPAAGAFIMSFFSGWTKEVKRQGVMIAAAASLWGVSIILFGLAHNLWLALFFLSLAGAFDGLSAILRSMMWNETIPNKFRGRLAGIEMISYLSGPKLGDAEAGLVATLFGITASVVSGGILCIAGVALSCYFLPKFWRYTKKY